MSAQAERSLAAMRVLTRSAHLASADDLPALAQLAGSQLGATSTVIYVIDYNQLNLMPFGADVPPLLVEGTLAGRTYTDVTQQVSTGGGGATVWAPILDGTDRLGVLEVVFDSEGIDDEVVVTIQDLAQQLAELVTIRSVYGDAIERARRLGPTTLAAELAWQMLPPLTFVSRRAAIAGVLLPTLDIAGDAFDYALNDGVLHVGVIDAMGHGLEASILSAVALSALRNTRRQGMPLAQRVIEADRSLAQLFGPDRFVTGIIGELDTTTGWWTWVTCGHPPALVIRGGKVVKELDSVVEPPIGLGMLGSPLGMGSEHLEPGDRLLLYSDGVVEARDNHGEFFGVERLVELIAKQSADGRPAAETLRRLNLALLAHQEGELQDDATTVLVEWLTDEAARSTP